MNVKKMAQRDAVEYARAQMFFGEGAGTRRRLIDASVEHNRAHLPTYAEAFDQALNKQDWSEHATMAVRERNRIDAGKFIKRNTKGLLTGNRQQMAASVATGFVVYTFLKETGMDKTIKTELKTRYDKTKRWMRKRRSELKAVNDSWMRG